jgi:MFS family permease
VTIERDSAREAIPFMTTVVLVGTLASIYMVTQLLRNSVGVIAPNLATELGLSASEIGLLSSTFFFAFAGVQVPLGIAIDRYGPKTCMLVCAAIAIGGALLFAAAHSPAMLITARVLMGIGSCCYLMAPLTVYARRYSPDRFSTFVGFQVGLGSVGTLLATAPLAFSVGAIGWRASFVGVALLVFLAAVLVALVVRDDHPAQTHAHSETFAESMRGLVEALRTPAMGKLFLMHLSAYSSFVLVVGLWGGPYLTHIYGYDLSQRGEMLFLAAVAQIAAAMVWGSTDRWFDSYKRPVTAGAIGTALALAVVAMVGTLPTPLLALWFVAVGGLSAFTSVMIAHGKSLFAPRLVGRGITLLNMGSMGGVFLSQTVSGFVIDLFPKTGPSSYPLAAYRAVFALQAAFILAACVAYFWAPDPRRAWTQK